MGEGFQAIGWGAVGGELQQGQHRVHMGEGFQASDWGSYNRGNIECNMGEGFQASGRGC
jgi:hypothetical protein